MLAPRVRRCRLSAGRGPRLLRPFFGPFLGFWTAFEAAASDYLAIPGGGLSSSARLQLMARSTPLLCCTPTYAQRLGEQIGGESGVALEQLSVRKIVVAGEPGGNVPAVRQRIEKLCNVVCLITMA